MSVTGRWAFEHQVELRRVLHLSLAPGDSADAVVWTTDMAELDPTEAIEVMAWMAT